MKTRSIVGLGAALLAAWLLIAAGAASAHHSAAMFDHDKQVPLTGTIVQFDWTNPHSWIAIDVPNESGGTDRWSVECNSPNNLAKQGWRSTTLKPGDKVTILIHPLRNGDKGGSFISVKLPDGTVLGDPAYRAQPKQPGASGSPY
ncbi:MAG TPA: DUF6152 family protein [Candidatus Aquilonibacter sp.]|nr:DUF6152 family protein [Candidatus Aquilonibacter sp.]